MDTDDVVFAGTGAGAITLVAGDLASSLQFSANGYSLTGTGATLALTSGNITIASGATLRKTTGILVVTNATGSATGSGSLTMAAGTTLAGNGLITAAAGNAITLGGSLNPGLPGSSASGLVSLAVSGAGILSFGSGRGDGSGHRLMGKRGPVAGF